VIESIRQAGASAAPVFVATESGFCDADKKASAPDNPIVRAQKDFVDPGNKTYAGPNLDAEIPSSERYDGCHLSGRGAARLARLWVAAIENHHGRR
jgi:hypothetical protein